ncbi:glycoside hydrolase family 43 protein [Anaerocolumna sp. MB42-C2]|uniref:glycoside hydrolase family 43 protein n=1 Tax=Anaerocolumna sp. MB42-C2 TaxID=3070997 RepID=UPI0027DF3652|nr:glycoside hydrolase family 43 protein [Anaerocolumna sp. MB42-C2]WMJ89056.1 glycoside hydrolase family 43 protein [Anaerocolumna sp. MB42-C2]
MKYRNPIISGYNPDPSICRVGDDYYIVNSTFEYFPGVPIYHSKNLANWELKGYCLTEESQLKLKGCRPSGGIFAPTLRYHNGTFFMVTTNVSDKGNFIVHTEDISKKWSEPAWVDQGGIDPSLLFDDDGKVYFVSTTMDKNGMQAMFLCEVNPFTGERLTESVVISRGCGGRYAEGPHLYKWFGKYYLMLAEGGTEYGHMETMLRAENPYGPYEECPFNPILTHRDDMREEIYSTGHADIMQDHNGNWWLVCLGIRPCQEKPDRVLLHNLGRETFLTPVTWTEDGWPVVGEKGLISLEMDGPLPGSEPKPVNHNFHDDFSGDKFSLHYNFIRNPHMENYILNSIKKELILTGTEITLDQVDSPTWLGIRQKGFETVSTVNVSIPKAIQGMRAGLTAFYNDSYHYEIYLTVEANIYKVSLAKHIHDIITVTSSVEIPNGDNIYLRIVSDKTYYRFSYSLDGEHYTEIGTGLVVGLCTESTKTMTFTGTYIGLFAENGQSIFKDFNVLVLD